MKSGAGRAAAIAAVAIVVGAGSFPALADLESARTDLLLACIDLQNALQPKNQQSQQSQNQKKPDITQLAQKCADAISVFRPGIKGWIEREWQVLMDPASLVKAVPSEVFGTRPAIPGTEIAPGVTSPGNLGEGASLQGESGLQMGYIGGQLQINHNSPVLTNIGPTLNTAPYRSNEASGGLFLNANLSRMLNLNANQTLKAVVFLGYGGTRSELGPTPVIGAANAGKVDSGTFHYGGGLGYGINNLYAIALAEGRSTRNDFENYTFGYSGSYDTRGYSTDFRVGALFPLWGSPGSAARLFTTSRPVRTHYYGLRSVWLDLSGHVGYERDSGLDFGAGNDARVSRYGTTGVKAMLEAPILSPWVMWMPYVGVSYDHLFDYSSTLAVPGSPLLPGFNFTFLEPHEVFGVDGGLKTMAHAHRHSQPARILLQRQLRLACGRLHGSAENAILKNVVREGPMCRGAGRNYLQPAES